MKIETYKEWRAIARREARAWPQDSWSATDMFHQVIIRLGRRFGPRLWNNPRELVTPAYVRREVARAYKDRLRRKSARRRGGGLQRVEFDTTREHAGDCGTFIDLQILMGSPEQESQANIDRVIWAAHLAGLSPFRIAKYLRLCGAHQEIKCRYVEAKIRQLQREESSR